MNRGHGSAFGDRFAVHTGIEFIASKGKDRRKEIRIGWVGRIDPSRPVTMLRAGPGSIRRAGFDKLAARERRVQS